MRRLFFVILAFTVFFMSNLAVLGGTPCHHFMHNNHDTLLIGEIIEIDDDAMVIKSTGFIISAGLVSYDGSAINLRHEAARQLQPEIAKVYTTYPRWQWPADFHVGDYVIASLNLNNEGDGFVVAWGIYKVDSLDYQTLTVDAGDFMDMSERFTEFVNSGGFGGYFLAVGEEPAGELHFLLYALIGVCIVMILISGRRTSRRLRDKQSISNKRLPYSN